jgi:hypothetical protein
MRSTLRTFRTDCKGQFGELALDFQPRKIETVQASVPLGGAILVCVSGV